MKKNQFAEAQMMIRRPSLEVYNAFIDPAVTQHFWFTKSSGKLEIGKEITWSWEMYNFSAIVVATALIQYKKITFEWYGTTQPTTVEIDLKPFGKEFTFVTIKHYGFDKVGDELTAAVIDSTGGFTMVLAGLKAYLEHGVILRLIGDKHPPELQQ